MTHTTYTTHTLAHTLQLLHRREGTDAVRHAARVTLYQAVRRDLLPHCRQLLERHPSPTARDADDLVSDALVALLFPASAARCVARTDAEVIAYLQQTITRDWLDERRRDSDRSEGPFVETDAARCIHGLYTALPYPPHQRRALQTEYTAALTEVPPEFRTTWHLVVHDGHTTQSVGDALGIARSTVSNRCAKVRLHLQQRLASFLPMTRTRDPRWTADRTDDRGPSRTRQRVEGTPGRL